MRIKHIINIFKTQRGTDVHVAMPIALAALQTAKSYARTMSPNLQIEHLAAYYEQDANIVPKWFTKTKPLEKTANDIIKLRYQKNLPVFREILDRLAENSDHGDILVYTNADIIVQPFFYSFISKLQNDCCSITRRCISADYTSIHDLPKIYSEIGRKHPGHDCFVFTKEVYEQLDIGDTCIGTGHMEVPLLIGLASHAKNFEVLDNAHVTIHLGDERSWTNYGDLTEHNLVEIRKVYDRYKHKLSLPHVHSLVRNKLAQLHISVEEPKTVMYQPRSKMEGHTVVLPYFSKQELDRLHNLADYLSRCTFRVTNCKYNFLVVACSMPVDDSLVAKLGTVAPTSSYATPVGKLDYGSGSCSLFWDTAQYVHKNYPNDGFMLWMEADMVPLKPDWIDRLDALWDNNLMIMGMQVPRKFYTGSMMITTEHINGGACYSKRLAHVVPPEGRTHPFDMSLYPYVLDKCGTTNAFRFLSASQIHEIVFDESAVVGHAYVSKHKKDDVIRDTIDLCSDVFDACVLPVNSEQCCGNARDFASGLMECPVHGHARIRINSVQEFLELWQRTYGDKAFRFRAMPDKGSDSRQPRPVEVKQWGRKVRNC